MPIDIRAWLDQAPASLQAAFGPRLLFLGLQGSYGRGEAQEGSDIDLVVILDEAAPEDWRIYRGPAVRPALLRVGLRFLLRRRPSWLIGTGPICSSSSMIPPLS